MLLSIPDELCFVHSECYAAGSFTMSQSSSSLTRRNKCFFQFSFLSCFFNSRM